ncbi:chemotaxis protein CheC [Candidatus Undinarchaeota archaeon]
MEERFTSEEKKALKCMAHITAEKASAALSEIVGKPVKLSPAKLKLGSLDKIPTLMGKHHKLTVAIYRRISGEMHGNMLFSIPREDTMELLDIVLNLKKGTTTRITGDEVEALKSIEAAVSKASAKVLRHVVSPHIITNRAKLVATFGKSLSDLLLLDITCKSKECITLKSNFKVEGTKINGEFALLIPVESLDEILKITKISKEKCR